MLITGANPTEAHPVVGARMKETPGLVGRVFQALGDIAPELVSMGGNEINLSLVVPERAAPEAMRRLHSAFFGACSESSPEARP